MENNLKEVNFSVNTDVLLCYVSLQLQTGNQIWFETKELQEQYFQNGKIHEFNNVQYIRIEDGVCYLPVNVEQLRKEVNYICIRNSDYSDKWYYCNILSMDWVNINTTKINFAVDTIQTYRFEMELDTPTHIIRRHYSYKNDGYKDIFFTPNEGLDIGDTMIAIEQGIAQSYYEFNNEDELVFLVTSSEAINGVSMGNYNQTLDYGEGNGHFTPYGENYVLEYPTQKIVYDEEKKTYTFDTQLEHSDINVTAPMQTISFIFTAKALKECYIYFMQYNANKIQSITLLPKGKSELINSNATNYFEHFTGKYPKTGEGIYSIQDCKLDNSFIFGFGYNLFPYLNGVIFHNKDENNYNQESQETYNQYDMSYDSAIMCYLMKPNYTILQLNDNHGNIKNLDLRYLNNQDLFSTLHSYNFYGYKCMINSHINMAIQPSFYWFVENYKYKPTNESYNNQYSTDKRLAYYNGMNSDEVMRYSVIAYFPVVNDYLSVFLQANQYNLQAQRGNIVRNYNTTIQNADTMRDAQNNVNWLNYQSAKEQAYANSANANINYATTMANANRNYQTSLANTTTSNLASLSTGAISSQVAKDNAFTSGLTNLISGGLGGLMTGGGIGVGIGIGLGALNGLGNMIGTYNTADANIVKNQIGASANQLMNYRSSKNSLMNTSAMASSQLQMARNTTGAMLTTAQNAYKGQQGVINANYQSTLRSASTVQQNAIDMLNAQYMDAQNVADTVTSPFQGEITDIYNVSSLMQYNIKTVNSNYLKRLINYWCMYGFMSNTYESINSIMSKFENGCYIKTSGAIITGKIPLNYLLDIISQFNSGIMLWKKEEQYLNYEIMKNE